MNLHGRRRAEAHLLVLIGVVLLLLMAAGCANEQAPSAAQSIPSGAGVPASAPTIAPTLRTAVERVNYYREPEHLPKMTADPTLNDGATKHARYVLENGLTPDFTYVKGKLTASRPSEGTHKEDEKNPYFTREGAKAAGACVVFRADSIPADGAPIIDAFMSTPFQAMFTLDPTQARVGFGYECKGTGCVVVTPIGAWPGIQGHIYFTEDKTLPKIKFGDDDIERMWFKAPVEYPAPGGSSNVGFLGDFGYFEALTSCPGYKYPAGAPIILSLGWGRDSDAAVHLSSHSLRDNGVAVESCAFDSSSYVNPDAEEEKDLRQALLRGLAIVVIPREPLKPGHKYDVSMVVDSKEYSWSFKVATDVTHK